MVTYDSSSKKLSELKEQITEVKTQIKVAARPCLTQRPLTTTTQS